MRVRRDESESLVLIHLGRDLCGHDGIVHGGMLAALLDEALGRTGVLSLPGGVGFTASMTVEYRSQTLADQFVAIRTTVARKEGRKAWVEGVLEDLSGKALVEAKYVSTLKLHVLLLIPFTEPFIFSPRKLTCRTRQSSGYARSSESPNFSSNMISSRVLAPSTTHHCRCSHSL